MKRTFVSTLLIAFALLFLIQVNAYAVTMKVPLVVGGGSPKSAMIVREIHVLNDEKEITVKFELLYGPKGLVLGTTHVHLAAKMEDIPQKNGNPIPGRFDHSKEPDFFNQTKYRIPILEGLGPGDEVCIAAHAEIMIVGDETIYETGWGAGKDFPGKNWAMYMVYKIQKPEQAPAASPASKTIVWGEVKAE